MIWNLIYFIFRLFNKIYFSSQKKNWKIALESSSSYQSQLIFDKVINCYEEIKNKNCEFYERDGLILDTKPNESDLIEFLKINLSKKKDTLEVLDFGGSLGSRFFSNYNFIKDNTIHWNIIEQEQFVNYGKKNLEKKNLSFFYDLSDCIKKKKIDCIIFSGSLQYFENYFDLLNKINETSIKYIFIDYLPLSNYKQNKIFVQNIPKKIVYSSYPIHILSKKIFTKDLQKIKFKILKIKMKKTIFYGFNYHCLILEN